MGILGYISLGGTRVPLYESVFDTVTEVAEIDTSSFPVAPGDWTADVFGFTQLVSYGTYYNRFNLPSIFPDNIPTYGVETKNGAISTMFNIHKYVEGPVANEVEYIWGWTLLQYSPVRYEPITDLSLNTTYEVIASFGAGGMDIKFRVPGNSSFTPSVSVVVSTNEGYIKITNSNYLDYIVIYADKDKKAAYMNWISPDGEIKVSRGDVIENIFSLQPFPLLNDLIEPFTDVNIGFTYITDVTDTPQESLGPLFLDIQGTTVTIGERMYLNQFKLIATANGWVYGPTGNPLHPEGDPVRVTKIVTVIDPWDRVYDEGGTSSGGIGGGGSHTGPGGSISGGGASSYNTRGDLPIGSAEADSSNTGLFTRYALSATGLHGIARALYADTILQNIGKEVMSFLWNSPSEGLVSLVSYPFNITSLPDVASSSVTSMKFGSLELPVAATKLGSTFTQIEWGTITLNEYWGNFLDYAPHTKIDLYLPWCTGSVSIDPHECLPGSLEVVTNLELAKGTCCHSIFGNKGALIGTYYGTCGSVLPLTAIDTSGKALALVTAAAGAMSAIGNAGAATSAGIAAANSPETTARAHSLELSRGLDPLSARTMAQREAIQAAEAPYNAARNRAIKVAVPSAIAAFRTPANIVRNGSFVANGPGMAMQYPFIILSRPEQNVPANYAGHYGYPSNVLVRLGSTSGYTEVAAIHLDGISGATMNEIEEIDSLLKGGVIL